MIARASISPQVAVVVKGVKKCELDRLRTVLRKAKGWEWDQLRSAEGLVISVEVRSRTSDLVLGRRRGAHCYVYRHQGRRKVDTWQFLEQVLERIYNDFAMQDVDMILTKHRLAREQRKTRRVRPPAGLVESARVLQVEEIWHFVPASQAFPPPLV